MWRGAGGRVPETTPAPGPRCDQTAQQQAAACGRQLGECVQEQQRGRPQPGSAWWWSLLLPSALLYGHPGAIRSDQEPSGATRGASCKSPVGWRCFRNPPRCHLWGAPQWCMRSVYAVCVCGGMFTCPHPTAYGYHIRVPHTASAYRGLRDHPRPGVMVRVPRACPPPQPESVSSSR